MYATLIMVFVIFCYFVGRHYGRSVVFEMGIVLERVLSCLIIQAFCNFFLLRIRDDLVVNITEISMVLSAILGIPGILFLYAFRWISTMIGYYF